ncbi:uncharacterized protein LOC135483177 [Lineus longissimus]|uniref:uncharacterized protein LOC135483177 n=1 Tax=Lineus longissimus TaxID=88925 RepID=UPI00315E0149
MTVDTGSERNIVGYQTYMGLFCRYPLKPTSKQFKAYGGSSLNCKGYFNVCFDWEGLCINDRVYVMEGTLEPLLGRKTTFDLKILTPTENVNKVNANAEGDPYSKLLDEFKDVFEGNGHIRDFVHKVTSDPNVEPVVQRLRRKP